MCHVGRTSVLGDDFNMSPDRDSELRVLSHPSLRPWLLAHNIALTSYQELAKLWHAADSDNGRKDVCVGIAGELRNVGASICAVSDAATLRMDISGDETVAKRRDAETETKRLARRGRLLILSSMTAATGNATTALRLADVVLVIFAPTLCLPFLSLRLPLGTR